MEWDTRWYMWVHPALQITATVIGFIVMYWGWKRFQMAHLKKKVMFPWKKHVFWGSIVLLVWALELPIGLAMAQLGWGAILVTDLHYMVAFAITPLCVTAYVTGYFLDRYKKKRKLLPIVHGVNNLILCLLIATQLYTGAIVIKDFLLY